ncbi:hypothetical protein [uncultured Bradyrhizobium sp.]|uniref:hypothetical protein n=1 Tax=uncultured Bradyrhizobium sp. TaxID=199684 RepID=UPI0035CA0B98
MKAFRSIRDEMREAMAASTQPTPGGTVSPMQVSRPGRRAAAEEEDDGDAWRADPWMEAAFEGLTHASETGEPFALIPCTMNGNASVVIALIHRQGRQTHVMPLFLACQPWMKFGPPRDEPEE